MKLSDVFKAKDLIAALPHTVLAWVTTVLLIICMGFGFYFGRSMFRNWQNEKRTDRLNDSIMINSLAKVNHRLGVIETGFNRKIDSLSSNLLARDLLHEQKINSLGRHIKQLENGNNQIIDELNNIDTNFKLFTSPFLYYNQQKKTLSEIPLTCE